MQAKNLHRSGEFGQGSVSVAYPNGHATFFSKSTVPQQEPPRGNTQKIPPQSVVPQGINPTFWSVYQKWVVCMVAANPNYNFNEAWTQFVNTLKNASEQKIPVPTQIFWYTFDTWLQKKFATGRSYDLSDIWGQFRSTLEDPSSQKVYELNNREFYRVFEIWLSRKIEKDNDFSFKKTWEQFLKALEKEAAKHQSLPRDDYDADETVLSQEHNNL